MFNGTQMWIKTHKCLVREKDPKLRVQVHTKLRTQQYIQLNTGAKEVQQLNTCGLDIFFFVSSWCIKIRAFHCIS